jgi:DNA-binding NtrC family response regulator
LLCAPHVFIAAITEVGPMGEPIRVLAVDDEVDYLKSLKRVLSRRGFHVDTANGGSSALAILEKSQFDCVLLDLKMPGMDGLATLSELRLHDRLTPVLLLTGRGEIPSVLSALKGGSEGFLAKPCPIEELVSAIEDASERKALSRACEANRKHR